MEHIERAGVHSGDSMAVYPGINLTQAEVDSIVDYTTRIGLALNTRGLMNVQYVIMSEDGESKVYVLEVNPRASRTVPFSGQGHRRADGPSGRERRPRHVAARPGL